MLNIIFQESLFLTLIHALCTDMKTLHGSPYRCCPSLILLVKQHTTLHRGFGYYAHVAGNVNCFLRFFHIFYATPYHAALSAHPMTRSRAACTREHSSSPAPTDHLQSLQPLPLDVLPWGDNEGFVGVVLLVARIRECLRVCRDWQASRSPNSP